MDDDRQFGEILQCPGKFFFFFKAKNGQHLTVTVVSEIIFLWRFDTFAPVFDPAILSCGIVKCVITFDQILVMTCPATISIRPLLITSGGPTTI